MTRNLLAAARQSRLIVRHLLLPGHDECCLRPIVDWLKDNLPQAEFSLRTSYLPSWRADRFEELQPANWLVMAMVHQRAGHADEARQWLGRAIEAIENHYGPQRTLGLGMHMHDWLACLLLRREAETLIAPKDTPLRVRS